MPNRDDSYLAERASNAKFVDGHIDRGGVDGVNGAVTSTLQEAAQKLQIVGQLAVCRHQFLDLTDAVHDRGVITPTESTADFGQAAGCKLFGQIHRNLPGPSYGAHALRADHVGQADVVVLCHFALNFFDSDFAI